MSVACQVAAAPIWPGVLGVGVTLLVGAAATWVAYNQFRIAQANLRLALFDRRFAVLERVREFLYLATAQADVDIRMLSVLQQALIDAPFLFGDEVVAHLEEIRRHATLLKLNNVALRDPAPSTDKDLAREKTDALSWLVAELTEFPKLLQPYMGFDEWRLTTPAFVARIGGAVRFFKRSE